MIVADQKHFANESPKNYQRTFADSPATVASISFEKSSGLVEQDEPKHSDYSKLQSASFKRVSFGCAAKIEPKVQTFVYESGSQSNEKLDDQVRSYSPSDSLAKLRVELVDSEQPCSIEPPSEISYIFNDGTIAAASSLTGSVNSSAILTTTAVPPEIRRRMEDHENPFRPDGSLCFEVEPIIEEFKHKPYRQIPSPLAPPCSVMTEGMTSPDGRVEVEPSTISESVPLKTVGLTKSAAEPLTESLSAAESLKTAKKPSDIRNIPKTMTNKKNSSETGGQKVVDQVEHKVLLSPKAAQPEMVHLDDRDSMKKPKCACCVIQ